MIITKEYLLQHRTSRGAWTKAQTTALGVESPPRKGWPSRIIGTEITAEAAKLFEKGSTKYAVKSNLIAIKKRLHGLTNLELIELKLHIDIMINKGKS